MKPRVARPSRRPIPFQHSMSHIGTDVYHSNVQVHGSMLLGPPPEFSYSVHNPAYSALGQNPPLRGATLGCTSYGPSVYPAIMTNTGACWIDPNLSTAPPPHDRPLYSHIPLPIILHDELSYTSSNGQGTYLTSSVDPRGSWSEPATDPALPRMMITLPPNMERITVYPYAPATDPGVVTVGDVQLTIEKVMSRLGASGHIHLSGSSSGSERRLAGKIQNYNDATPLEHLRQQYGRAGLLRATNSASEWLLQIG